MRPSPYKGGSAASGGLASLLVACVATLFIASRLWISTREIVHLRTELVEVQARAAAALEKQRQLAGGAGSSPAGDSAGGGDPALAGAGGGNPADPTAQPLLFYSVRSMQPGTQEPPPLAGPRVEEDPLPIQHDPAEKLTGQVNSVEAGRVHGWACLKGGAAAELAVSVYVDGVLAGRGQASLPTQTPAVRRLCQLDSGAGDSAAARAGQPHLGRDTSGVGFVVPLPPLPQGLHTLRVFVEAPPMLGAFRQELNQSPLLFRESSVSPDQEERIRRKDAIIQTRNAQVASLWEELHTKQPWRNAISADKPIRPFPEEAEAELAAAGILKPGDAGGSQDGSSNSSSSGGGSGSSGGSGVGDGGGNSTERLVAFIGINTGLTSRARRDILRRTWVPAGGLDAIEREHGVRIRFFVGYSQQRGDRVEQELQEEMKQYGDMERLDVVDEYNELSRKTARLFSHMSGAVVADFYFKIDDDVAVNVPALADYLRERRAKGNLYLGCMKSGEVLTDKRWKWYEPEHWRFGDPAGRDTKINYMRHASGQIYGMSRPVARYIAQNEAILHRYANEDVAVGSWLVGLDVDYDNQRRLCCDTEWKCTGQSGRDNVCLGFSENQCAGLCRSEERLEGIYRDCIVDPYNAGKKGKLPWWGASGWATRAGTGTTGSTGGLAESKDKGEDKKEGEGDGKKEEAKDS
ncbi:hypothetical protein ABPG77_007047 [Micractinium sp. CCAP 211/92]